MKYFLISQTGNKMFLVVGSYYSPVEVLKSLVFQLLLLIVSFDRVPLDRDSIAN